MLAKENKQGGALVSRENAGAPGAADKRGCNASGKLEGREGESVEIYCAITSSRLHFRAINARTITEGNC